jgi:hypothetical protein
MIHIYSIANDTLNGVCSGPALRGEIRTSAITKALDYVNRSADVLTIGFKEALSASDIVALNTLIAAHTGIYTKSDINRYHILDSNEEVINLSAVQGPQGDTGDTGAVGPAGPAGSGNNFGANYQYAESESESSTTSGSYQTKLTLTTPSLASGNYRMQFSYEMYTSDSDANYQLIQNDVTVLHQIEHTSVDEFEKHHWMSQSGFKHFTSISGVNTFKIQYNDDGGGSAKIRRARIELWRVDL